MSERRQRHRRAAFLGTLAGGLAHEIRNPLSTMKVNLQLLREDLERGGEESLSRGQRRVAVLEAAVRRLEEIVNDFLNFARGFELRLEPADVTEVVDEVVVFVEPEARRHGAMIRAAHAPGLPRVAMDRKYFQQALLNLLLNARQAIEATGRQGEIFVTTKRVKGRVHVQVTDTGPGIPPDVLPRIFDVYFSTKKGGTGLGLATTRRVIEEHRGQLTVATEVGKGTSFTISMPAVDEPGAPPSATTT